MEGKRKWGMGKGLSSPYRLLVEKKGLCVLQARKEF